MQHRSPPLVFVRSGRTRITCTWIARIWTSGTWISGAGIACLWFACAWITLSVGLSAQGPVTKFLDPIFQVYPVGNLHYADKWNPSAPRVDRLELDLYLPLDSGPSRRPCFVYLHGGSFRQGSRRESYVFRMCFEMAQRGYVAAAVSYRLRSGAGRGIGAQSCGEDCQDAIKWLMGHADSLNLDPQRVVVTGDSAGAAGAVWAAFGQNSSRPRPHPVRAIGSLWGWESTPVRPNGTAVYVTHGELDRVVPWYYGRNLHIKAVQAGNESHFQSMIAGHAPWERFDEFFPPMVEFFYRALKLSQVEGLHIEPTQTPGVHEAVVAGPAERTCVLRWSPNRIALDLGDPGFLYLDLDVSVVVDTPRPPVPGLVAQRVFRMTLPPNIPDLHWQGFFLDANKRITLLTNSPTTSYR